MGLEVSVTQISDLNSVWPLGGDDRSKGDDHIRNLKVALKSLLASGTGLVQLGFPDKRAGASKLLIGDGTGFVWKGAHEIDPDLITGQTADASPATGDYLLTYDVSASALKKVLLSRFNLNGQPVVDDKGNVRSIPQNAQTAAYAIVATDAGKQISITTGGVTLNTGVLSVGDAVTIYNNSASSQTITQGSGVTLRLAGTTTTGNRTLAQRGLATLLCVGAEEFVISGGGLT